MVTASSGNGGFLGMPGLREMVYENRRSYAHRHGYEWMWANISTYNITGYDLSYDLGDDPTNYTRKPEDPVNAPLYWNKMPVLKEAFERFPKAEWIWWLDMDIIIMNHSLSMWDHVLSPEGMARNAVHNESLNKPGGKPSGWHTPATYKYEDMNFMISSGGWGMNVGNFLLRRSEWSDWLLDLWADPLFIKQGWTFPENDAWTYMWRHMPVVRKHTMLVNQRALNAYADYNGLGKHWQQGDHVVHFAGCGGNKRCPKEWQKYWAKKEDYEVPAFITEELANGTAKIESDRKGEGFIKA
jgi:hypothetical protein